MTKGVPKGESPLEPTSRLPPSGLASWEERWEESLQEACLIWARV